MALADPYQADEFPGDSDLFSHSILLQPHNLALQTRNACVSS